jgi:hypothetical protein
VASKRQRERKKLRARFHALMQSRKARRRPRVFVGGEEIKGVKNVRIEGTVTAQYPQDAVECWEQAKRRRQGKVKTLILWQKHMEARGYSFNADKHGGISVLRDGLMVGGVAPGESEPDVVR